MLKSANRPSCALLVLLVSSAYADSTSIGPNGIDAANLKLPNGVDPLTGDGVSIGQMELTRPGDPGYDSPAQVNSTVNPAAVYLYEDSIPPIDGSEIDDHALGVAGVMISTDGIATGVATQADLYSASMAEDGLFITSNPFRTAQNLAMLSSPPGVDLRAVNLSFGWPESDAPDGNSQFSLFLDWSAHHHDILYVAAGSEDLSVFFSPDDNYNGMTIATSGEMRTAYFCKFPIETSFMPTLRDLLSI